MPGRVLRARAMAAGSVMVLAGAACAQPGAGGAWQVHPVQMEGVPGGRACLLSTEDPESGRSNPWRWSLRFRPGELAVIEYSIAIGDATIPQFGLAVGGERFGPFPIGERRYYPENVPSVVKYVSAVAASTDPGVVVGIVSRLRQGVVIRIERRGRVLERVLDAGAAVAFEACRAGLGGTPG